MNLKDMNDKSDIYEKYVFNFTELLNLLKIISKTLNKSRNFIDSMYHI